MSTNAFKTTRPDGIETCFYKSNERNTARYVSDTVVREEALEHGRLIGLYWSAIGQVQRENITSGLPKMDSLERPIHVFELEIDGQLLHNRWDWVQDSERPESRPGTVEAVVELKHQIRPISVKVVTRLDGSPILARWLEITNTGDKPAALSKVSPWSGLLWNSPSEVNPSVKDGTGHKFTLGYLAGEKFGHEGHFIWRDIPTEKLRIERTRGTNYGTPYFILRNELTGETAFAALAWSANYYAEFAHRFDSCLFFSMGPLGPAPLRVIKPGETVLSPEVHLGLMHTDMDSAVQSWHRHVRASVIPPRPEGKSMYTVAGRVVEEPGDWILREVDIAAEMGVESFMVDAGWYGKRFDKWWEQRGDWCEGSWLPGGLAGIRQYIHDKGMLFGLWMEPETIAEKSKLSKEHPDWVIKTDDGRRAGETQLNMGKPEVAQFVRDEVIRVIREHKPDFYKLDYNVVVYEGGQNIIDGYAEHEAWRHYETLHQLFRQVREEFPDVALENCASGGGRNDLGMLSVFHYAAESDWSLMPFGIRAINAMTLFLPPEALAYYHNHIYTAHLMADLDTHLRVTLFATPVFVGFGAQSADRSTSYFKKTKRYIELAKTFCRPVMANHPVVYHHTPDIGLLNPGEWCVLEYGLEDKSRGYCGVFKLSGHGQNEYILNLGGVDINRSYVVTFDNRNQSVTLSGWELANNGISISLDAPLTSELVLYKALD